MQATTPQRHRQGQNSILAAFTATSQRFIDFDAHDFYRIIQLFPSGTEQDQEWQIYAAIKRNERNERGAEQRPNSSLRVSATHQPRSQYRSSQQLTKFHPRYISILRREAVQSRSGDILLDIETGTKHVSSCWHDCSLLWTRNSGPFHSRPVQFILGGPTATALGRWQGPFAPRSALSAAGPRGRDGVLEPRRERV
jgi:hypothetical protein